MCCVGIVIFNPDIQNLMVNIEKIITQERFLILVDNCSENRKLLYREIESLKKQNDFIFISNNQNYGIAYGLNQIMKKAQELEFESVLLLDQDSSFPISKLHEMSCYLKKRVGIVAPIIVQKGTEKYILNDKGKGIEKIDKCITSGSLTSIEAWEKVKGFDENLFIDGVDFDFCKRLAMNGYLILKYNNLKMEHELGIYKSKKFLNRKIYYSWHSKTRTYYIIRNMVYMERKYKDQGRFFTTLRLAKQLCEIIILLDEKKERILIFLSAIRDGIKMDICTSGVIKN